MKGICFKEPLFHAVVNGTKTQTRRIIEPQPIDKPEFYAFFKRWVYWLFGESNPVKKPRYKLGEKVYLKEPYYHFIPNSLEDAIGIRAKTFYKYYCGIETNHRDDKKWKNKLFMPAKYARYFIEITGVRCERLQDISDGDCEREGICPVWENGFIVAWSNKSDGKTYTTRKESYAALIDKINGKNTWEINPFVWVYDFKLVK
jgi:hypothetical protein